MKFIGREHELNELNNLYGKQGSNLVVIYGRRRVGKSTLIEKFMHKKPRLHFEGIEKVQTKGQIEQFMVDLRRQVNDPLLQHVNFKSWPAIFNYLADYFEKQQDKTILFFDEFQWLAANQSKLVSLVKSYWDRLWRKCNVMLVLCGSVSSYMTKKVISSKALYGRINWELSLQPFSLKEISQLLGKKRGMHEIFNYALILGGIPKYLQEIDLNQSFDQNINKFFFIKNGLLVNEYSRIFYSQFKEHKVYEAIAFHLKDKPLSLKEIAYKVNIPSGGGLKNYLKNLEKAAFITSYTPYAKSLNSKLIKYKLTDEYLRFYFKYVAPKLKLIKTNQQRDLFSQLVKPVWQPWLGFAYENFCIKHAMTVAEIMGFADHVIQWGPLFHQKDTGFQIDLVYVRNDHVITVCEIKFYSAPIGVGVIKEVERKCRSIVVPKGYTLEKALISRFGPDESLKQLQYFHHSITVADFFAK